MGTGMSRDAGKRRCCTCISTVHIRRALEKSEQVSGRGPEMCIAGGGAAQMRVMRTWCGVISDERMWCQTQREESAVEWWCGLWA